MTLFSNVPSAASVADADYVLGLQGSTGPGTGNTAKMTLQQIVNLVGTGPLASLSVTGNASIGGALTATGAVTAPVSTSTAIATGSTAERNLAARFAQQINVKDFGAKGDNATDDGAAITAAVNYANTLYAQGIMTALYFPSGQYFTTMGFPTFVKGGSIIGDGPYRTWIRVGTPMSGDLFSWSESWIASDYGPTTANLANSKLSPFISGLSVLGDTSTSNTQNAFVFYDRNDRVVMQNVDVYYMAGAGLSIGGIKNFTQGYMRESCFINIKLRNCGTASIPAVLVSSTTTSGSDATNEIDFYKLRVYAAVGDGVVVSNPNSFNNTRAIRFFGLQSENNGGDGVKIGLSTDTGQVSMIDIYGFESPNPQSGHYALNIDGGSITTYAVNVQGSGVSTGAGGAVRIGNARLVNLRLDNLATTGSQVTFASTAGGHISLEGPGGGENSWTYSCSTPAPVSNIRVPFFLRGIPGAGDSVGAIALKASASGTTAVRLTQDGAAASAVNSVTIPSNSAYGMHIHLMAHDATDGSNWYSWSVPAAILAKKVTAASTTVTLGTPVELSSGTGSTASTACTADTANGALNLSWTPPSGNTDTWNVSALITFATAS